MVRFVTVTEQARSDTAERAARRCAWCRRPLPAANRTGRPRRFCKHSCRQRDFEARRRLAELGIGEHELIVTRTALDGLRDELYALACAVEDVERDLADAGPRPPADVLDEALRWLLEAARPLCQRPDLVS
jgi:hypothetical protein